VAAGIYKLYLAPTMVGLNRRAQGPSHRKPNRAQGLRHSFALIDLLKLQLPLAVRTTHLRP